MKHYSQLSESAIIADFYEHSLNEGLGDMLKKAVSSIKQLGAKAKEFIMKKADVISAWVDKNIFEPLKAHISKFIPGYSWGSNKDNADGIIESVIKIFAKSSGQAVESRSRFSAEKSQRVTEGIRRYVRTVGNSFIHERKNVVVESGAIGAVLSVIHWSHFAVDVLEAILKVAPSIPFLAGLTSKLLKVTEFLKNNPKLSKLIDWWEHGKIPKLNLPVKDVVNAICIAVGIVEICMGGGIFIILSTAASAAWVIFEKIIHHYKKADKEAATAIEESSWRSRRGNRFQEETDDDDLIDDIEDDIEDLEDDIEELENYDDSDDDDEDFEDDDSEDYDDDENCDPDDEDCDDDIEDDSEDEDYPDESSNRFRTRRKRFNESKRRTTRRVVMDWD